jgi:hypothetical protein
MRSRDPLDTGPVRHRMLVLLQQMCCPPLSGPVVDTVRLGCSGAVTAGDGGCRVGCISILCSSSSTDWVIVVKLALLPFGLVACVFRSLAISSVSSGSGSSDSGV